MTVQRTENHDICVVCCRLMVVATAANSMPPNRLAWKSGIEDRVL